MKETALKMSIVLIFAFCAAMLGSCASTDPRVENPSRFTLVNKDAGLSYGFEIQQKYLEKGPHQIKRSVYNYVDYAEYENRERYERRIEEEKLNSKAHVEHTLSYNGTLTDTYSNLFRNNWHMQIAYWDANTPIQKNYIMVPALEFTSLVFEIEDGQMSLSGAERVISGKPVEIVIAESSTLPGIGGVIEKGPWKWRAFTDAGLTKINMYSIGETVTFYGNVIPWVRINNQNEAGFAGWTITPDAATLARLKTATAISFKVRGDGQTYRIQLPTSDITDGSYYETTFPTNWTTETTVTVSMSDFAPPKGGSSGSFNKRNIESIQMMVPEGMRGRFRLTISDLTLIQ